jgi:membrane associated rhomboid family serine protease
MDKDKVKAESDYIKSTIFLTVFFVAVMWLSWFSDRLFQLDLRQYGIISRSLIGLRGILFSPFIHESASMAHIMGNTLPFALLFFLLLNAFPRIALVVYALIQLISGFLLWLFGPADAVTVGMSGVIFGLAGFLIGSGIFRRNLRSIAIALIVMFFYGGGLAASLVPTPGVSWQGHVCGAVAGLFVAFNLRNYDREPELPIASTDDDRHFFERYP